MPKNIEFRKLSKSGNFDIIVPEGRFELEVLPNKSGIKSIVGSDGFRKSVNRSDIFLKYRKEINDYFYSDKYAKGSTIVSKKPKLENDDQYKYQKTIKTKSKGKTQTLSFPQRHTAEEVFDSWNVRQWRHFCLDHNIPYVYRGLGGFKELPQSIKDKIQAHVKEGQYKKGSTIKGAGANGKYLDSVSADKKTQILRNIANHYGVSLAEAEHEVKDADAEMLYEYITNDALRIEVYNDLERKKYKKGSTIKSCNCEYSIGGL